MSDNAAPVCPQVMRAIDRANKTDNPYDGDQWSQALDAAFSALFGQSVAVIWTSTGTAANALALSLVCPPFGGVLCHDEAHIVADECGAVEFATAGARLMGCPGEGNKLTVATLKDRADAIRPAVHQIQPHAVSITNATEMGRVYAPDEVAAIADFAHGRGLRLHMDGARFANAVARLDCSAADLTARAGVDLLSFGFTKNGAMNAEALILFDPALADEARRRRKRAGHLLSKGRFIAAQMLAMLEDDLWIANGRAANAAADIIAEAAGERLLQPVAANEIFLRLTAEEAEQLRARGFGFYDWGTGAARFVTSWHHVEEDVTELAKAIALL